MDEIYKKLRDELFQLNLRAQGERMMSPDKMTVSAETQLELKRIKREIAYYLLDREKGRSK